MSDKFSQKMSCEFENPNLVDSFNDIRILIKWHAELSVHAEAREGTRKQLDPLEGFGSAL
jgi:hypothetical protein